MPSDINYKKNTIEIDNEIESILQRIRVCLGTKPGKVLGDVRFGIDLEQYVFSMSFDKNTIKKRIETLINEYVQADSKKYQIKVDVNYGKDKENASDYAVIDIIINQQKLLGILVN